MTAKARRWLSGRTGDQRMRSAREQVGPVVGRARAIMSDQWSWAPAAVCRPASCPVVFFPVSSAGAVVLPLDRWFSCNSPFHPYTASQAGVLTMPRAYAAAGAVCVDHGHSC